MSLITIDNNFIFLSLFYGSFNGNDLEIIDESGLKKFKVQRIEYTRDSIVITCDDKASVLHIIYEQPFFDFYGCRSKNGYALIHLKSDDFFQFRAFIRERYNGIVL